MNSYKVKILRTVYDESEVLVNAINEEEAKSLAEDMVDNDEIDFSFDETDIELQVFENPDTVSIRGLDEH